METIAIIMLIIGFVEISKRAIGFRTMFAPLYALVYSFIAHYLIIGDEVSWTYLFISTVIVGLASCGLYSAFKPKK